MMNTVRVRNWTWPEFLRCSSPRHDAVSGKQSAWGGAAVRPGAMLRLKMLADVAQVARVGITVGADRNYNATGFVASCRANRVTLHVAQNDGRIDVLTQ